MPVLDRPYTYEARTPDALMAADLPDWTKMIWIAIRSVQGRDRTCDRKASEIAARVGKSANHVYQAKRKLIPAGFLHETVRGLRCTVPCEEGKYDVLDGTVYPARKAVKPEEGSGSNEARSVLESEQCSEKPEERSGFGAENEGLKPEEGSEKSEEGSGFQKSPLTTPLKRNQQTKEDAYASGAGPGKGDRSSATKPSSSEERSPPPKKHPAVGIYRSVIHLTANHEQRKLIAGAIDPTSTPQLTAWKTECRRVMQRGWKKTNVAGILERTNERLAREGHEPLDLSALETSTARKDGRSDHGNAGEGAPDESAGGAYSQYVGLIER